MRTIPLLTAACRDINYRCCSLNRIVRDTLSMRAGAADVCDRCVLMIAQRAYDCSTRSRLRASQREDAENRVPDYFRTRNENVRAHCARRMRSCDRACRAPCINKLARVVSIAARSLRIVDLVLHLASRRPPGSGRHPAVPHRASPKPPGLTGAPALKGRIGNPDRRARKTSRERESAIFASPDRAGIAQKGRIGCLFGRPLP